MKRICFFISLFAFMLFGMGADAPAVSVNTFGIVRVESATTNTLIAVPWTWYSEREEDALDILAKKLVKTNNLEVNDLLYCYLANGTYRSWVVAQKTDGTGELYWEPCATVTRGADGTGSIDINGDEDDSDSQTTWEPYLAAIADDDKVTKIARGNAVWLRRQHPTANGQPKPFWIYGQSVSTPVSNEVAPPSGGAKYMTTLLGNPYVFPVKINDLKFSVTPDSRDRIFVPDGTLTPKTLMYTSKGWRCTYSVTENGVTRSAYDYNVEVPAGLAFWYDRRGTSPMTITWDATPKSTEGEH